MSDGEATAICEVAVPNPEGLHARPVMRFVDMASNYASAITVSNVTRTNEEVDGKSAMQMMLLEATQGNVLRIHACGADAAEAVKSLEALVKAKFHMDAQEA